MSNNIYRNSEGYYDPTAGAVLAKCGRKEKTTAGRRFVRQTHRQGSRCLPKTELSSTSAVRLREIREITPL